MGVPVPKAPAGYYGQVTCESCRMNCEEESRVGMVSIELRTTEKVPQVLRDLENEA